MKPAALAWSLFALAALLAPVAPLLRLAGNETNLVFLLSFAAVQLSMASVGAFVASRLPGNRVGWLLVAIGLGLGLRQAIGAYGELGNTTPSGPLPADDVAAWLGDWPFLPIVVGGVVFLLHLFPDGRFISRRWTLVALASGAVIAVISVADALKPGRLDSVESVENPVGASGALADLVGAVNTISGPLALLVFGLAAVGMGVRVRRAAGVERQQIKWVAFVLALVIAFLALSVGPDPLSWISLLLALIALASLPVAAGVAILRYRLYDIDVVINRALVYGALTATLAAAYLGSVLLLQLVLSGITGDSSLAVAGSTLAVAGLFRPARSRIQHAVDRRFYRRKYDAARTLEAFAARLRDEVDLDALGAELRAVVAQTMQPAHVSLWLRASE
ncbi:MAG: hypothetical protein M3N04_07840 [Actinomycetota bacterium]|nr:hypothetical protein [Actinomycetota bacterium]